MYETQFLNLQKIGIFSRHIDYEHFTPSLSFALWFILEALHKTLFFRYQNLYAIDQIEWKIGRWQYPIEGFWRFSKTVLWSCGVGSIAQRISANNANKILSISTTLLKLEFGSQRNGS